MVKSILIVMIIVDGFCNFCAEVQDSTERGPNTTEHDCACTVSDFSLSTAALEVVLLSVQERYPLDTPLWRH